MRQPKFKLWLPSIKQMTYSMTIQELATVTQLNEVGAVFLESVGVKDTNGCEIHEGDILQDEKGIGEVLWVPEHCAFMTITREPSVFWRMESDGELKHTEVIGNIYENPELLQA